MTHKGTSGSHFCRMPAPAPPRSPPPRPRSTSRARRPRSRPGRPGLPRVVGKRSRRRVVRRHLAQHPHDHDNQHTGHGVGEESRWSHRLDHHARAHEQAGADDAANRDHGKVPLFQALVQLGARSRWLSVHRLRHHCSSPFSRATAWTFRTACPIATGRAASAPPAGAGCPRTAP